MITTTPGTVFKKVREYVPVLPDNARKWTFCLPSVYYNDLTDQIKQEIQYKGYTTPPPLLLRTKEDQLQIMPICRSIAITVLKKVKQYERSMSLTVSKEITNLKAGGHHVAIQPHSQCCHHPQQ